MNHSLQSIVVVALVFSPVAVTVAGPPDFNACLANVQAGLFGIGTAIGGTDNHGRPVNVSVATAVTYDLCLVACGAGSEPFSWNIFSQQFNSWLFPWLALISQLPFGGNDKMDNMVSMLLTVGSPTLAAYSLILTILNDRWMARRFSEFTDIPNAKNAISVLRSLQQTPLTIRTDSGFLESLIVLPENDKWWSELIDGIDGTYTWSISAASSTVLVILAFLFTLIDSFTGDITSAINANGQAVGSLWLWLLPIIIGWLRMSPKCDSVSLQKAINRANAIAYVATTDGSPPVLAEANEKRAFELSTEVDNLRTDEKRTAPIYNYARLFSWVRAVEKVAKVFEATRYPKHHSVKPDVQVPCHDMAIEMDQIPSDATAGVQANNSVLSSTTTSRARNLNRNTTSRASLRHLNRTPSQTGTVTLAGQSSRTTTVTALPSSDIARSSSIDLIPICSSSRSDFIDQEPAAGVSQEHDHRHTGHISPLSAEGVANNSTLVPVTPSRGWQGLRQSSSLSITRPLLPVPSVARSSSEMAHPSTPTDLGSSSNFIDSESAAKEHDRRHTNWGSGRLSRIVIASVLALTLQWGTAGSAIIVAWFTPTIGLGCRSFSYLLYAVLSTIAWMLLLVSSILTHSTGYIQGGWWRRVVMRISIIFRRLGKFIAALNALLMLAGCVFQFSNLYNNCFCNSSVFSLRGKAYFVIKFGADEMSAFMSTWIVGAAVAGTSAILYTVIAIVLINPMPTDKS